MIWVWPQYATDTSGEANIMLYIELYLYHVSSYVNLLQVISPIALLHTEHHIKLLDESDGLAMGLFHPWHIDFCGLTLFVQTQVNIFKMAHLAKASLSNFAKPIQETVGFSLNMSSTSLNRAVVYLHNHSQLSEEGSKNPPVTNRLEVNATHFCMYYCAVH
jgi:hypothetical protein